ncbi:MAG: hypothetical protein HQL98_00940 [Magnetococcales bacterium]|nr:hypothetical protein [Magnetococcales bacterium]
MAAGGRKKQPLLGSRIEFGGIIASLIRNNLEPGWMEEYASFSIVEPYGLGGLGDPRWSLDRGIVFVISGNGPDSSAGHE